MAKVDVLETERRLRLNRKIEAVKSGGPDRHMLSKHDGSQSTPTPTRVGTRMNIYIFVWIPLACQPAG